ncbi:MAG: SoxR reducing system RseC family protein [Desulfobacteraceae bacterium]
MATEKGIVTSATRSKVWVKTKRASSCEACEASKGCSEKENIKEMTVQVDNTLNAVTGDQVVLGFNTGSLLKITFLLYIFPILMLMAGAAAGEALAPLMEIDSSLASILSGFLCFAGAFFIIRKINSSLSRKKEFSPHLVRRMGRSDSAPGKAACREV